MNSPDRRHTRTYVDPTIRKRFPLRATPKYFMHDLNTLVVHQGGGLLPSAEFFGPPEIVPETAIMPVDYCDYSIKMEIDDGVGGPEMTVTMGVVLDLIAAASAKEKRYRRVRDRSTAKRYSFHLSCYQPAAESFLESVSLSSVQ
jgi:hypothetical protein